jgi:alkylation response protein AidB-like acyl-CoA dehydrogenase
MLLPTTEVDHQDNWRAAGMAGTATNIATVTDVFVPAARTILMNDLAEGHYPKRRYSQLRYFDRPFVMYVNAGSAPALLGMARGAMDCFMQTLPTRGAITFTAWSKAAEAPFLHHQLAKAQYDLEAAEMFTSRLSALYRGVLDRRPTIVERAGPCLHRPYRKPVPGVRESAVRGQQFVTHPAGRRYPAVLPRHQRVAPARGHPAQHRR